MDFVENKAGTPGGMQSHMIMNRYKCKSIIYTATHTNIWKVQKIKIIKMEEKKYEC